MSDIKKYLSLLGKTALFGGMDEEEIKKSLDLLCAEEKFYKKGDSLHFRGDPLLKFGLVLDGAVSVMTDDVEGNKVIMAQVSAGVTFGEALCFLKHKNPDIYIVAYEDCRILWLSPENLFVRRSEFTFGLEKRFAEMVANRTLAMNDRIQILSKRTIREKVIAYLTLSAKQQNEFDFTVPLNREDMAAYIGADRSALSRELSKMKKDGIIDYHGKNFEILRKG